MISPRSGRQSCLSPAPRSKRLFNRQFLGFRCAPPQALRCHPLRGFKGFFDVLLEKTMSKYEMVIYWSEADGAFVVEVPELPGCMADGATYQEAVANAERIVQEWIETAGRKAVPSLNQKVV